MSTDRELLELAAKAAGIEVDIAKGGGCWRNDGSKVWPKWNPLTDDGDALRLAVRLRLDIQFFDGHEQVMCEQGTGDDERQSWEDYAEDVGKATRRAIVRAAAEIGRTMP